MGYFMSMVGVVREIQKERQHLQLPKRSQAVER
jgi:hypothetical protein